MARMSAERSSSEKSFPFALLSVLKMTVFSIRRLPDSSTRATTCLPETRARISRASWAAKVPVFSMPVPWANRPVIAALVSTLMALASRLTRVPSWVRLPRIT